MSCPLCKPRSAIMFVAGLALLLLGEFNSLFIWIGIGLIVVAYLLPYTDQIRYRLRGTVPIEENKN